MNTTRNDLTTSITSIERKKKHKSKFINRGRSRTTRKNCKKRFIKPIFFLDLRKKSNIVFREEDEEEPRF